MKLYKIFKICCYQLSLLLALMTFTNCEVEEFLDKAESGGVSQEEVFGNYVQTQSFLANIYASGIGNGDWMPAYAFTYAAATDEAICPYNFSSSPKTYHNGTLSPTNNPIDVWNKQYQNIRKANILLENIDGVPVSNDPNQVKGKSRMKGEGYFLRAWFYAELLKRYGGVPIVDRPLDISDNLSLPRNTVQEVVDFIVSDCDEAAELLDPSYTATNLGRATKGAAMMLKSRVLLLAASPLHNTGNDKDKWEVAAQAAKDVMDLGIYSLYNDYQNVLHTRTSNEIIFQSTINQVWGVSSEDWVRHVQPPSQGVGWATVTPLQNIVDDYEMANGLPITDPASGYDEDNPYVNRDPRFYQSVIYNDSEWANSTIYTYVGSGVDGLNYTSGSTKSGYYMGGKMLDENSSLISTYRPGSHYWVFMRYAETLLNYAEAQNEAFGPDQTVYDAVNKVRNRPSVEMPDLPADLSMAEMRDYIRHERRIELAFEGHRFWDVRRWRIGDDVFDAPAYGMRITNGAGGSYNYEKFIIEERVYDPAFDLFPIPQAEIEKNPELKQNKGY